MVARPAAGPARAPAPRVPAAVAAYANGLAGAAHAHLPAELQVYILDPLHSLKHQLQQIDAQRYCCALQCPMGLPCSVWLLTNLAHADCDCTATAAPQRTVRRSSSTRAYWTPTQRR